MKFDDVIRLVAYAGIPMAAACGLQWPQYSVRCTGAVGALTALKAWGSDSLGSQNPKGANP